MSVVSAALASMVAGEWRKIHSYGDGSGLELASTTCAINHGNPQKIFDYSSKCLYDAERKRIYYKGGSHMPICEFDPFIEKMANIAYDFGTAQFTKLPFSQFDIDYAAPGSGNSHMYQLQTFAAKHRLWIVQHAHQVRLMAMNVDVNAVSSITDWGYPNFYQIIPGSPGAQRGCIEYFPDRDSIFYLNSTNAELYEKRLRDQVFTTFDASTFYPNLIADGLCMLYSPIHHKMVLGGGDGPNSAGNKWWTISATGTPTAMDAGPAAIYFARDAVGWIDPVTGNLMVISAWDVDSSGNPQSAKRFYELNLSTGHWTRQTSEETLLPTIAFSGVDGATPTDHLRSMFDCVGCALPDLGGTIFFSRDVWLYKRDNNTYAADGPDKTLMAGHLAKVHFTSRADLKPSWVATDPAQASVAAARGYSTNYTVSQTRGPTEGNCTTGQQPVGIVAAFPDVDADGLKFNIPSRSAVSPGAYDCNFDGILHDPATQSFYLSPVSPHGRVFYLQFRQKLDAAFRNHHSRNLATTAPYTLTTSGAGSTTLIDATGDLIAAYAGREIHIHDSVYEQAGTNFVGGFYTIQSVTDASHCVLDRTPTPSGAGTQGFGQIAGSPGFGRWSGTLSTTSGGSLLLHNPGGPYDTPFTAAMVGNSFAIYSNVGGLPVLGVNFVTGGYTVESVQSATQLTLTSSPTPSGAGSGGYGAIGGMAGGYKTVVIQGCPPYTDAGHTGVMQNRDQWDYPGLYEDIGGHAAEYQFLVPYAADTVQEFTIRGEVKGQWTGTLSCAAGSTTLTIAVDAHWVDHFTTEMVTFSGLTANNTIAITGGTNFVAGTYTMMEFFSATQIRLSSSPAPTAAGSSGSAEIRYGKLSRMSMWVDGQLVIDWKTRNFVWSKPPNPALEYGVGALEFTFYQTQKDATEVHADGYAWLQDIITSTEPIPMALGAGSTTEPPPVPRPELIYPFLIKVS